MESTRIPTGLLRPQSPVTWALCAAVPAGNVVMDTEMPTCATGINEQGQLLLVIGTAFLDASGEVREQMLRHEAHHVFCNHMQRRGDRDPQLWNQVCDAAIHYQTNVDWELIEQEADDLHVVTFDRLDIPPMAPELAYDRLVKKGKQEGTPDGCGSGSGTGNPMEQKASTAWVTVAQSIANAADVEMEETGEHPFDASLSAAEPDVLPVQEESHSPPPTQRRKGTASLGDGGQGKPYTLVLPEPPEWVERLLANLSKRRGRRLEGRSYRREHRLGHPLLPGYGRSKRFDGVFMVDASGSIDTPLLMEMLSAVCATPELREAKVYLFDTRLSPEFSSSDMKGIAHQVHQHRGGTRIKFAHQKVGTDRPLIWFTDAMSADGLPPENTEDIWVVYGYGDKVAIKRHPTAEGEL